MCEFWIFFWVVKALLKRKGRALLGFSVGICGNSGFAVVFLSVYEGLTLHSVVRPRVSSKWKDV